jgi:hypothetical protein
VVGFYFNLPNEEASSSLKNEMITKSSYDRRISCLWSLESGHSGWPASEATMPYNLLTDSTSTEFDIRELNAMQRGTSLIGLLAVFWQSFMCSRPASFETLVPGKFLPEGCRTSTRQHCCSCGLSGTKLPLFARNAPFLSPCLCWHSASGRYLTDILHLN